MNNFPGDYFFGSNKAFGSTGRWAASQIQPVSPDCRWPILHGWKAQEKEVKIPRNRSFGGYLASLGLRTLSEILILLIDQITLSVWLDSEPCYRRTQWKDTEISYLASAVLSNFISSLTWILIVSIQNGTYKYKYSVVEKHQNILKVLKVNSSKYSFYRMGNFRINFYQINK